MRCTAASNHDHMKHLRFLLVSLFILGTRWYDFMSTRTFQPVMAGAKDPASFTGAGWSGATMLVFCLTLYAVYALYVSTYKQYNLFPKKRGLSLKELAPYVYLGKPGRWTAILWHFPKSFTRFTMVFGSILAWGLVWAGAVTTAMWLLIRHTDWYYPNYHYPVLVYLLILLGMLMVILAYFKSLYSKYQAHAIIN